MFRSHWMRSLTPRAKGRSSCRLQRWVEPRSWEAQTEFEMFISNTSGYDSRLHMRYLDSGDGDPNQTLGAWFKAEVEGGVSAIRFQSGYFDADGLGFMLPALAAPTKFDGLIGSNNGLTPGSDVQRLVRALGLPRADVRLGIVSFSGALFHPKVYHLTRDDGTATAYVGSANLSERGVSGAHVEAGVVLDSRSGDDTATLAAIVSAIDAWFVGSRAGVTVVSSAAHVDALVGSGLLAAAPRPRPAIVGGAGVSSAGSASVAAPNRKPLLAVPPVPPWAPPATAAPASSPAAGTPVPYYGSGTTLAPGVSGVAAATGVTPTTASAGGVATAIATTTQAPFPSYILFDPASPNTATSGLGALTQVSLPGGAVGLIVKLSKDTARQFAGGEGTTNMPIPVGTLATVRFGWKRLNKFTRPRAEFDLVLRYVGANFTLRPPPSKTNIMPYGFLPGEKGHRDVRMLLPAAVERLSTEIARRGGAVPKDGDLALLEWPTPATPGFALTFVELGTPLAATLQALFAGAAANGTLVGDGACWLPPGVSPP